MPRCVLVVAVLLFAACSSESPRDDTPAVDAGEPVDAGAPDAGCDTGQHACGDACVSDDAVTSCGTSCTPCEAGANEEATCDQGACGTKCINNTRRCGDACVAESEQSCGATCQVCSAPKHAFAYCSMGQCGVGCIGDYIVCESGACGHTYGDSCSANDDCCSGRCENSGCCAAVGSQCQMDSDCTTFHCGSNANMKCSPTTQKCCSPGGAACGGNDDCCSGTCSDYGPVGKFCK